MRINYDLKGVNVFKRFNESMGIALFSRYILRNRKLKFMKYTTVAFIELMICVIFLALTMTLTRLYFSTLSMILLTVATIALIFIIMKIITPLCNTCCYIQEDQGEIEISDKGISFILDEEVTLTIGWSHLKGIIIGKYSINFMTDYNYYFYLDKKKKKEIIKCIKEYNSNIIIIGK